jgi:phage terminase large subunit GpA-like protein
MADDFVSQRRFPVPCPSCGEIKGYPIAVQTLRMRPGQIRIDICCHACRHEWFQEVESEHL